MSGILYIEILTSTFALVCFEFLDSDIVRESLKFLSNDCVLVSCVDDSTCCEVVAVDVDGIELTIIILFNGIESLFGEFNDTLSIAFGET